MRRRAFTISSSTAARETSISPALSRFFRGAVRKIPRHQRKIKNTEVNLAKLHRFSGSSPVKKDYLETIALVERLHRECLEVIRADLERLGIRDLNNVQALILFN